MSDKDSLRWFSGWKGTAKKVYRSSMKRIRFLPSFGLLALTASFSMIGQAKVLSCDVSKGDGQGWIPQSFKIDLSRDRKTAKVISPVTATFGAKPFEKSLFGSSLWSRGKGKSDRGDFYNYQLQLDLHSNDTQARMKMTNQGFRDIEVNFRCSADSIATTQSTAKTESKSTNRSSYRKHTKKSDADICFMAKAWGAKDITYANEVKSRGLDCGVESSASQVAKTEPKSTEPSAATTDEVRKLKQRLAQLESEKRQTQQSISADTQPPVIRITTLESQNLQARISAEVTDDVSIGQVTMNGLLPLKVEGSTYSWETFVPSEGLSVLIEAVDQRGLISRKSTRVERTMTTEVTSRLAAVNPLVGPNQKPSRDRAALIIGLEQYKTAQPAQYAAKDAQMFADYAREKLGVPAGNIKVLTDEEATRNGLLRALKVWLPTVVKPDTTDLYVFYAGHGMASDNGESAYLVPYAADVLLLDDTAITRSRFYSEVQNANPRTATFFFDNCYSGATRSEELLLASRPLGIKVRETDVPDNYLVFAAGESDQTAGVLDEVKHGRFSYFLFKGLEGEADTNSDAKISAGELQAYLSESVGRWSAGAQTPTMLGNGDRWVLQ